MTHNDDDQVLIESGYKPQLRRSLGFFSSFAVSFSCMSILMGIFTNYGYVLSKAGPFGIWTWPLVGIGQMLVALVFAEMAGRVPLTGAIYNWNSKLTTPVIGWLTGWMTVFVYSISTVGIIIAMMTPLQSFLGREFDAGTVRLTGAAIILIQAAINVYGIKLAAGTNKIAVIAEVIALVVFGAIILMVILLNGEAHIALVTTIPDNPRPYWPGFTMAILLAAWTIFGFESPSDFSEETVNVRRIVPQSILSSILFTIILGFAFIMIITLAIPDLAAVSAAADPVSAIIAHHLGSTVTKIFLLFVILAMFATALLSMATAARILFAMARDKRFLASPLLARVSDRGVPIVTIMLILTIEILTLVTAKDFIDLYAIPVVLLALVYLATVVNFAIGLKNLPAAGSFSLGHWHWPVVVSGIIWLVAEIGILTIPQEFHSVALETGGVIVVGCLLYPIIGRASLKSK